MIRFEETVKNRVTVRGILGGGHLLSDVPSWQSHEMWEMRSCRLPFNRDESVTEKGVVVDRYMVVVDRNLPDWNGIYTGMIVEVTGRFVEMSGAFDKEYLRCPICDSIIGGDRLMSFPVVMLEKVKVISSECDNISRALDHLVEGALLGEVYSRFTVMDVPVGDVLYRRFDGNCNFVDATEYRVERCPYMFLYAGLDRSQTGKWAYDPDLGKYVCQDVKHRLTGVIHATGNMYIAHKDDILFPCCVGIRIGKMYPVVVFHEPPVAEWHEVCDMPFGEEVTIL